MFFDGLPYLGAATRVFARIGVPETASVESPVPALVLVHGGGGTAYSNWVDLWVERGYAAISIAVEGQTDTAATEDEKEGGLAVGHWRKHATSGPARVGAYGDVSAAIEDQWMYHAVADTVLANSFMRSLPFVDETKVGLMGISWGGVITATAMGIDERFAFAIPTYGNGRKFDIPNYFGNALGGNAVYQKVWDPVTWLSQAEMPSLWLTWRSENNFSLDSQAASYHETPGMRHVAIVPEMGHSHGAAWNRPDSYDFADAIVAQGSSWARVIETQNVEGVALATIESQRELTRAELVYTTEFGYTGDLIWQSMVVTPVETEAGVWSLTEPLPNNTRAWFINAYAASTDVDDSFGYVDTEVVVSSDYVEVIALSVSPEDGLDLGHPLAADRSSGLLQVSFTGPSYVEIVDVSIHSESHPGAFCGDVALPLSLRAPTPTTTGIEIKFDNTVAGL